ncbi:hypothetical protein FACS1894163_05050 [Spirochaetia bacterium]|nr:hypothetical protein FACS1894163_05050 [Spirochaetia bacterium]
MFVWYLIIQKIKIRQKTFFLFVYLLLLIVGCIFYGRIGLVVTFVVSVLSLFYIIVKFRKIRLFFSILIILTIISIWFLISIDTIVEQYPWVGWALEPIINLHEKGKFASGSSDRLLEMYTSFPDFETMLHGDGRYLYSNGSFYMHVDVGFLRPLFFWGLIPTLLYYLLLILLLIPISYKLRKSDGSFLFLLCLIQLTLFEVKGETLLKYFAILLPIYLQMSYAKYKSNKITV